jgi:hypothetical protein
VSRHPLLSSKVYSKDDIRSCGIDRLELRFEKSLGIKELNPELECNGVVHKKILSGGTVSRFMKTSYPGLFLLVNTKNQVAYGAFLNFNNKHPSKEKLFELLPLCRDSKVSRIDFNIDINEDFEALKLSLRVKNKQISRNYFDRKSKKKGNRYGSGDSEIAIYHKGEFTRIEHRLKGKRLPKTRSLSSIIDWIKSKEHFSTVEMQDFKFNKYAQDIHELIQKHNVFIKLLFSGYAQTGRLMDFPQNQKRDLRKYVEINKSNVNLDAIFKAEVTNQLGGYNEL